MSDVTFLGYDADGDKVWQHTNGRVTHNPTRQGAERTFECSGGKSLAWFEARFGPITKEKP